MDFIDGETLKNILNKKNCINLSREIGEKVAVLHNNGIIHHDLTTSNMILGKDKHKIFFIDTGKSKISGISRKDKIFFIDFGLSFFSEKIEDKAVDLHLLKEALESKHPEIWVECYNAALDAYKKNAENSKEIIKRLKAVEQRGRYKHKK